MADEDYMPDPRDLEACPACGSGRIACVLGLKDRLDFCMQCHRVWERLPLDEPYTIDGEQLAFRRPCDNCAFRGDSKERADRDGWQHLQSMLGNGGEFYCHKGVPFNPMREGGEGFEFPKKESTVDLAGTCHPYQHYDKDRMRLCRGYLNAHIGPLVKKMLHQRQRG
jgi:hypothetical protein